MSLTILGDFWDIQLYRGRLYLWTMDGRLGTYNWDALVDELAEQTNAPFATNVALARGNYLYQDSQARLHTDSSFTDWFAQEFERVRQAKLEVGQKELAKFLRAEQDNPFDELPTDTEIYNSVLYGISDGGLWRCGAHRPSAKYPVSQHATRLWDGSLYSVRAQGRALALAAGAEGLLEYDLTTGAEDGDPRAANVDDLLVDQSLVRLSGNHCSDAEWAFSSIYASSTLSPSYMAAFDWHGEDDERELVFLGTVESTRLPFDHPSTVSWASQDKLYSAGEGSLDVLRFKQSGLSDEDAMSAFASAGTTQIETPGNVVAGGVGYFGAVVEAENGLEVIDSAEDRVLIDGPITRWRVYPRAINYENHLHVIVDDAVVIYSFGQDYGVAQWEKRFGIRHANDTWKRWRRR